METIQLNKAIKVLYVKASSFPAGVLAAWEKLHTLLPSLSNRHFYGLSQGDKNGGIVYMAAVEESFEGEAEKLGCDTLVIPPGNYLSETLTDWKSDMSKIGTTFQKLLSHPEMDPNGFCLEVYFNDSDVKCMVKLN